MRHFIRSAAFAAMVLFVPLSAPSYAGSARLDTPGALTSATAPLGASEARETVPGATSSSVSGFDAAMADAGRPDLAPGQSRADYYAWLARDPRHQQQVQEFREHLAAQGLEDVVPVWQLIRTSSSWRACNAERFEVAPREKWTHITTTLRFVRDEVEPVLGDVEAVSGYRNERLNRCSAGAPQSAHRNFFALDLSPVSRNVNRGAMIRQICAAHARDGRSYNTGLGFYNGMRFHVDSNGFRRWGANGSSATSPCGSARYA